MEYVEFDLAQLAAGVVVVRFHRLPASDEEVQAYLRRFRTLVHAAAGLGDGAARPLSLVFALDNQQLGMPSMALVRAQADFITEIRPLVEERGAIRCTAVVGGALIDVILRLLLAFVRPIAPLRVFPTEAEALVWARAPEV